MNIRAIKNPNFKYIMRSKLAVTEKERHLGFIVDIAMKMLPQSDYDKKRQSTCWELSREGAENKIANILMPPYRSIVQSHFEAQKRHFEK